MKKLVHFRYQKFEELLQKISEQNELYIARSFSFNKQYQVFLKECQDFYEQIGDTNNKAELGKQRIYFETALKGINPQSLEKVGVGKRENIWIAAFHTLSIVATCLQTSIVALEQELAESKALLGQTILSALQSNLLTNELLQKIEGVEQTEHLWKQLIQENQIQLIDKKLKLSISDIDIYIILDKIIVSIK